MKHIGALFTRSDSEGVFDAERDLLLLPLQVHHPAELDLAEVLRLVPEVHLLSVKDSLRPGKEQRVLMGMVRGKIARDLLPSGRVNRMNVAAPTKVGLDPFWDWLFGLDVFQHGLAAQGDTDLIGCFREFQVTAKNGWNSTAHRAGKQAGNESGKSHGKGVKS